MILKTVHSLKDFPESWKTIIDKTPVEIVKQLAIAVSRFFQIRLPQAHPYSSLRGKQWSPFTISANHGDMNLLHYIINKIKVIDYRVLSFVRS